MASSRFADTAGASALKLTESAAGGTASNHKDRTGADMSRAAPGAGFATQGAWARPLMRLRNAIKSEKKEYDPLPPSIRHRMGTGRFEKMNLLCISPTDY